MYLHRNSTYYYSVVGSGQRQQRPHRVWQGICLATPGNDARRIQGSYRGPDIGVACRAANGDEVSTATMCPTTQCASCWCPREQLQDSDHVFPFRDTQEIRAELATERARLLNQDGTARDRCKDRVRF